jgi:hypothetical protein
VAARRKRKVDLSKLVPAYEHGSATPDDENIDGEPTLRRLRRFANDQALRAEYLTECCGCGLTHLYTLEVFTSPDGEWFIAKRPYRVEDPKRVPDNLKPRRKPRRRKRG